MKELKKLLIAAMIILMQVSVTAAEISANEKMVQMEIETYGGEQTGAILGRINRLEKDYSGTNMQGNMNVRINSLYEIMYGNAGAPSLIAKINAIEWNAYHEVTAESIIKRLDKLENEILGKTTSENIIKRINELAQGTFGSEQIPLIEMQVPNDVLIRAELAEDIGSRSLQAGDIVNIKVAENVIIDGKLIIAKGQVGKGTVTSVRKAKGWMGRNGKINIDFQVLNSIDGNEIEIYVGEESKSEMRVREMIGGAAMVGMNINDDWNKLLVHGKNIELAAGTALYVQTKKATNVYALQLENDF